MAHFWASIKGEIMQEQKPGQPGRVAVEGIKKDGMLLISASWTGAVKIKMFYNEETDENWVTIRKIPWNNVGIHKLIYSGPIGVE